MARPVSEHAPGRDIVVVGASAGGVEALRKLVENLPTELSAEGDQSERARANVKGN